MVQREVFSKRLNFAEEEMSENHYKEWAEVDNFIYEEASEAEKPELLRVIANNTENNSYYKNKIDELHNEEQKISEKELRKEAEGLSIDQEEIKESINSSYVNFQDYLKEETELTFESAKEKDKHLETFVNNERNSMIGRGQFYRDLNLRDELTLKDEDYKKWSEVDRFVYDKTTDEKEKEKVVEAIDGNLTNEQYSDALQEDDRFISDYIADEKTEGYNVFSSKEIDEEKKNIFPANIEEKYLNVNGKLYLDRDQKQPTIEDKGNRLQTKNNNPQTAKDIVNIAEARGWEKLKISGTASFRREVWLEAQSKGLAVQGYKPSGRDIEELRRIQEKSRSNFVEQDLSKEGEQELDRRKPTYDRSKNDPKEASKAPSKGDDSLRTGQPVKTEAEIDNKATLKKEALKDLSKEEALKIHPDLKGTYDRIDAIKEKLEKDNLTEEQKQHVLDRVTANAQKDVEKGFVHAPERNKAPEVEAPKERERVVSNTKVKELER